MRIKWFSLVRVTGLLFVLTYHFWKNFLPGGFLGVDVFFVFSGYLITALFIDEFTTKKSINFFQFVKRRLLRIFPPLLLVVLVTLPLALLISKDFLKDMVKQVTSALGFFSNFYEATNGSYEAQFTPHLFVHTWSLSIEFQFYIIWGLIIWLTSVLIKRKVPESGYWVTIRARVLLMSVVLALVSFTTMFVWSFSLKEFSPIYYSSIAHIFPFFVGASVASFGGIRAVSKNFIQTRNKWSLARTIITFLIGFITLTVLAFTMKFTEQSTFLFGFLIASIAASLMIYSARILHEKTPNTEEPKVLTFLADISYSVYLFHWPLMIIFEQMFGTTIGIILTIIFSIAFSAFSYYLFEPIVAGKTPKIFDKRDDLTLPFNIFLLALGFVLVVASATSISNEPQHTVLEEQLIADRYYQDANKLQQAASPVIVNKENSKEIPKGVTIIGDSVTVGARDYLTSHIPDSEVDAMGNRRLDQGYDIFEDAIKNNTLRENVVIALGTNGEPAWQTYVDKFIKDLPAGHRLILMTPHDGKADSTFASEQTAEYERTLIGKYDYLTIADWNKVAKKNPQIFVGGDGTHFAGNPEGSKLFNQVIQDALTKAEKKSVKL
ncbi:MAG: acyltransferase [Lactobacillaceae bacterium]|jgi:peptidoglycan/LPS O-acetylase OafA/YrhL|nr:acyltransferase [Lactobacillaceae bacterium]